MHKESSYQALNAPQKKAVQTTEGRVLILAGAGSGKTSVLTHRIAHLIENNNVPASAILGLTFTNKAAAEMRQRVAKLLNPKLAKQVTLCTFHSFCMQVLREEIHKLGYTNSFSLYNEKDVRRLVTQLVRETLQHEGELPSIEPTLVLLSQAKSKLHSPDAKDSPIWHDNFLKNLHEQLETSMRAYNAVDFDSLLSLTIKLFEGFPDILEKYQNRFRYIMIDEYQDTNPVQYHLSSLLSRKHNNLCVVGDDDQSIYGWRGAEIKHILDFKAEHVVKLEQNYRSTPVILQAANAVIANNLERHSKELWSNDNAQDPIIVFHAPSDMEEANSIVQRLIWFRKNKNLAWKDMAILYRSNILARPLETALMQASWQKGENWVRGIPYQVFGGTEFYERSEIRDLVAYLKVISNPLDQEALLRIVNVPRRGISDAALDMLTQMNRKKGIPLWNLLQDVASGSFIPEETQLSSRANGGIGSFVKIIQSAQEKFTSSPMHEALTWLVESIDYKKAISEEVKSDKMREFKWDNVLHFIESMKNYEDSMLEEGKKPTLFDYVGSTLMDEEKWQKKDASFSEDRVHLMTFHSAKGLEFTACFLIGLEDHIIPHEKSVSENGLEEERRLMYVAMTRAKKHLTLSMSRLRKRMGKDSTSTPSRFLFEIPKHLLKVTSWQTLE